MAFSLLIMAAGVGSRFGGLKQFETFKGRTLLEYAVLDACKAGCTQVICVVQPALREAFETQIQPRLSIPICYAYQTIPPGRTKPLGTGHAVWSAREYLTQPFVVINADDYYGPQAFRLLARFFEQPDADGALVGYRLGQTLSAHGSVSRGLCREQGGFLMDIQEVLGLQRTQVGSIVDASAHVWPEDAYVSVNCWGLMPTFVRHLDAVTQRFLGATTGAQEELFLPSIVHSWMQLGHRIRVVPSQDTWCGVTYPQDKAVVEALL